MLLAIMLSIAISGPHIVADTGTCGLLTAILRDSVSTRIFKLNKHPELSIRFLDMHGQINEDCTIEMAFGKKVEIIHEPHSGFGLRNLDITIPRVDKYGSRVKVYYSQYGTGSVGFILLKKKRRGFKVTKVHCTQY